MYGFLSKDFIAFVEGFDLTFSGNLRAKAFISIQMYRQGMVRSTAQRGPLNLRTRNPGYQALKNPNLGPGLGNNP